MGDIPAMIVGSRVCLKVFFLKLKGASEDLGFA